MQEIKEIAARSMDPARWTKKLLDHEGMFAAEPTHGAEEALAAHTVGLVTSEQFKQKVAELKEEEEQAAEAAKEQAASAAHKAAEALKAKEKKRKKAQKRRVADTAAKLSFGDEDEEM
eukprot:TRINITY_DN6138_c0_g1_i5.p2 TRINITY_DN6138_c0_g1~~TRINITY_DN6138_c0_g1_i5.p2  ORF type:complete len:118 (-),score=53.03 TRINITY_DN6138_c0_g1_i5:77-430(-)